MNIELEKYKNLLGGYTELRFHENRNTLIYMLNGDMMQNSTSATSGVSARVYNKGMWGFSSSPSFDDGIVSKVIRAASDNAEFLASKEKLRGKGLPDGSVHSVNDFTTKKNRCSPQEKIDFLKTVDEYIVKNCKQINSRTVRFISLDMEKQLITSTGSLSRSMIPRTFLYITLSMKKDNEPFNVSESFGGLGQYEDFCIEPEVLFEGINELYGHLEKKMESVHAEAGIKTCILDADLAGILAHEAIGHTTEADLVLGGSIAANYINKEAVSPLISLTDFANTALGKTTPVPVYVDDEGTKAEDAVIIDKGVLKRYMHNKETANIFEDEPKGNARAYSFSDEPLIRMRNTAILPGESKLEDMIASIDDGYYLIKSGNGQADSTSEFMFAVQVGYEIKKGKLGKAIRNTTISGVAFDVLSSVEMVSDDMKWVSSGMCGKKQPIPVGMGGPAIKCKVNIGGK